MNISTKSGDQGFTDLAGKRVLKRDSQIELLGELDELYVRVCDALCGSPVMPYVKASIETLFKYLNDRGTTLDNTLQFYEIAMEGKKFKGFLTPTTTQQCKLHLCRTQVRKCERLAWRCDSYHESFYKILNRMSDYFYWLASL